MPPARRNFNCCLPLGPRSESIWPGSSLAALSCVPAGVAAAAGAAAAPGSLPAASGVCSSCSTTRDTGHAAADACAAVPVSPLPSQAPYHGPLGNVGGVSLDATTVGTAAAAPKANAAPSRPFNRAAVLACAMGRAGSRSAANQRRNDATQRNDLCSCCLLMPEFPACLYSLLYWLLDHLYNSRHGQWETARRQSLLQVLLRTTVLVALPKNRALSDQSTVP